jgi:hypothetical protein
MNESRSVRRRYDLLIPHRPFLWEVPQKPVAVPKFHTTRMDRLEREAVESFRSSRRSGSEIGGC